jgi:hypothetical protein
VEVDTVGKLTLFCPKCQIGVPVSKDRHHSFWLKAANWCNDCVEVRHLLVVWERSKMMAKTLVDGKLRLPKGKLDPEASLCVLRLAGMKNINLDQEQKARLMAAALEAEESKQEFRLPTVCPAEWQKRRMQFWRR